MPELESGAGAAIPHTKCQYRRTDHVDWAPTEFADHGGPLYCPAQYYISNIHHASMYGRSVGSHSNKFPTSNAAQRDRQNFGNSK